jgi:hypothetical protein
MKNAINAGMQQTDTSLSVLLNQLIISQRENSFTYDDIKEMAEEYGLQVEYEDVDSAMCYLLNRGLVVKRGSNFYVPYHNNMWSGFMIARN